MGDYLNDLISKNLGLADVVKPRTAARFEPARADMTAEPFEIEDAYDERGFETARTRENTGPSPALLSGERVARPALTEPTAEADPQTGAVHTRPAEPAGSGLEEAGEDNVRIAVSRAVTEVTEMGPQGGDISISVGEEAAGPEDVPSSPSLAAAPAQSAGEPPVAVKPRTEFKDILKRPGEKVGFRETEAEGAPEAKMQDKSGPVAENIQDSPPVLVTPRVTVVRNNKERGERPHAEAAVTRSRVSGERSIGGALSEPPVINVTIGRIEVRATAAAAPPKERQTKPQTVNLDEYLRRRSGGGER